MKHDDVDIRWQQRLSNYPTLTPYQVDLCQVDTLDNTDLLEHIQRVGQPLYTAP